MAAFWRKYAHYRERWLDAELTYCWLHIAAILTLARVNLRMYQYSADQNQVSCCHLWWCSCARTVPGECYFPHKTSEDWWRVHKVQDFRYNTYKIILEGLWKELYFLRESAIYISKEEVLPWYSLWRDSQFSWHIIISVFSGICFLCCALL